MMNDNRKYGGPKNADVDRIGGRRADGESHRVPDPKRMEPLQAMARRIGHDFNNLLQPILGYAHLAKTSADREKAAEYLARVIDAAEKARELVERVSAVGQPGKHPRERLSLSDVVAEAVSAIRLPDGVALDMDLSGVSRPVTANAEAIHTVVLHLCSNACEATADGGRLRVSLEEVAVDADMARRRPGLSPGDYAVMTVGDDGAGMPPDTVERAFDPFFSTKSTGIGRGLGLVAVYDIAVELGGDVLVSSAPDAGTSVSVYIPVAGTLD